MPFPLIPAPVLPTMAQTQQVRQQTFGELTVKYERQVEIDVGSGKVTFEGSVVATYEQTVVKCERLALDYKSSTGVAEGGVELVDPEAFLTTNSLFFNWKEKTGNADDVYVRIGNMRMWAKKLEISPTEWRLTRSTASLSRREKPDYKLNSPVVRIYPGHYGVARDVTLDLFGAHLGTAKEMRFDLDPRIDGFNLPSITNKKGVGVGVSWTSSFLLNDSLVLGGSFGSFPGRATGLGFDLTYMRADPDKTFRKVKAQDDLKEQMGDGWFDNIGIRSPKQESRSVSSPRTIYSLATKWNTSTGGRTDESTDVSKAFEGVIESSGSTAGFGMRGTARFQRIRPDAATPFVDRFQARGTLTTPPLYLTQNFALLCRADAFGTSSKNGEYGWLRGQASLIWAPSNGLTFGAAYSSTRSSGMPDIDFDRPLYRQAVHGRMDAQVGPYTLRFLVKMDPQTGVLFDREYEIALVAESFEPFVSTRQFPNDYRIGVRFRMQSFVSRLQKRKAVRDPNRF